MKFRFFFVLSLALCLLQVCSGCQSALRETQPSSPSGHSGPSVNSSAGIHTELTTEDGLHSEDPGSGAVRIPYNGNISKIVYITSAAQLPEYEALAKYDDAYFRDHALILVYESVSSSSTQVGIASIHVDGSDASVTLFHRTHSQNGTTAMASWLLWAEVETGLDYRWSIENPALKFDHPTS